MVDGEPQGHAIAERGKELRLESGLAVQPHPNICAGREDQIHHPVYIHTYV